MADPANSVHVLETRAVGDTTYQWISTPIGEVIYAVRASGHQERLAVADTLAVPFRQLTEAAAPTEPLAQLRHEITVLARAEQEAAQHERVTRAAEHRLVLDTDFDNGTIDAEAFIRQLATTGIPPTDDSTDLTDRLNQHRTLAWLERNLGVGPIAPVLDFADAQRVEIHDTATVDRLEHVWALDESLPPVALWRDRPHGALHGSDLTARTDAVRSRVGATLEAARTATVAAAETWFNSDEATRLAAQYIGPTTALLRHTSGQSRITTADGIHLTITDRECGQWSLEGFRCDQPQDALDCDDPEHTSAPHGCDTEATIDVSRPDHTLGDAASAIAHAATGILHTLRHSRP